MSTVTATIDDLIWRPHPAGMGGSQGVATFENGYSVSVVRFPGSYGYEAGLWEMAIKHNGRIVYDTPITNDVLGHLSESNVSRHMAEVQLLPVRESALA